MMLRAKHANLMYEYITYYIYAYQLHCPKQDVLRTMIWVIVYIRHRSRHTSLYALLQKQHPCCFWL